MITDIINYNRVSPKIIDTSKNTIEYIEDNLKAEITMEELSEMSGFSLYYYRRLFHGIVGMSVNQYILRRKLLHAIYEISIGNKMIDVALAYGFETYAGFYKAFVREFGYPPAKYLQLHNKRKPYKIDVTKEKTAMMSHKKLAEVLVNWGLEKEHISDVFYGETGNVSDSAWYVGEEYVLKRVVDLDKAKKHMEITKAMQGEELLVAVPLKTKQGEDYWTEAVAITTTNNSFGPTEISYLENQFTQLAKNANRYIVKNGNEPNPGNITEEKESELEELKVVRRKEVAVKIREAREQGDLSENAEYDAAKDEQRDIEARIEQIEKILKNAEVVDEDEVDLDKISIGCKVRILDVEFDEEEEFKIVGSSEASSLKGKISNESPVGKALLGAKVGDTVNVETQAGIVQYKVLEIQRAN